MNSDQSLIEKINSLMQRSAAAGVPVATRRNSHFGKPTIPTAPLDFPIPRGLFHEANVPHAKMVGGFPTLASNGLRNFIEITADDESLMDEITKRDAPTWAANEDSLKKSREHARRLAEEGRSVSESVELACQLAGDSRVLIRHEFNHREISRDCARSQWGQKTN
jgi:hypothetical protein